MIGPIFGGILFLILNFWIFGVLSLFFGIFISIVIITSDSPIKDFECDDCKMNEVKISEETRKKSISEDDPIIHPIINNTFIQRPNEIPIGIWQVSIFLRDQFSWHSDAIIGNNKKSGTEKSLEILDSRSEYGYKALLIATNQRIIILKELLNRKEYQLAMSLEAPDIQGISSFQMGPVEVKAVIEGKGQVFTINKIFEIQRSTLLPMSRIDTSSFSNMLSGYVNDALKYLEEEKKKARIQYVLDFSFLKNEMEKGGVVLQQIKCPNCGAAIKLPTEGNSITCQYCQGTIYAQDIFEKMKGLIGHINRN